MKYSPPFLQHNLDKSIFEREKNSSENIRLKLSFTDKLSHRLKKHALKKYCFDYVHIRDVLFKYHEYQQLT